MNGEARERERKQTNKTNKQKWLGREENREKGVSTKQRKKIERNNTHKGAYVAS